MRDGRWACVLLVVLFLLCPWVAFAVTRITVGTGTAESCTETAFQSALDTAALSGSGAIRFRCGPNPITIVLTGSLTVPSNTTIDGGGVVTLSAAPEPDFPELHLMLVEPGSVVTLKNLTMTNKLPYTWLVNEGTLTIIGTTWIDNTVAIENEGTLTVQDSTFASNGNALGGGAIANRGTLTIAYSTFSDNGTFVSANGGAIANWGTLTVKNSTFADNIAGGGGGAIFNDGVATVRNSAFARNQVDAGFSGGGAIWSQGQLTVVGSTFAENYALYAGGLFSAGTLTVQDSTFTDNISVAGAGAIGSAGVTVVSRSAFFRNNGHGYAGGCSGGFANSGGGGIDASGNVTIRDSTFSDNEAACGGGIFYSPGLDGATLTIRSSIISHNRAERGGGIFNDGGTVRIDGSRITENTATVDGGGIYSCCSGTVTLRNTVVRGNEPNDIGP